MLAASRGSLLYRLIRALFGLLTRTRCPLDPRALALLDRPRSLRPRQTPGRQTAHRCLTTSTKITHAAHTPRGPSTCPPRNAPTSHFSHKSGQRESVSQHLLRNSFRYAGCQHWAAIVKALKPVHTAATEAIFCVNKH